MIVLSFRLLIRVLEFNARMRRIDLICKFAGPFFITIIDGISTEAAILTNLAMNIVSIPMEYLLIARVLYPKIALEKLCAD